MIQFMYRFEFDTNGGDSNPASSMLFNVKVYQVGDKYGISMLKACAKANSKKSLKLFGRRMNFLLSLWRQTQPPQRRIRAFENRLLGYQP